MPEIRIRSRHITCTASRAVLAVGSGAARDPARRMDLGEAGNQSGELVAPGRVGSCVTRRDPTERRTISRHTSGAPARPEVMLPAGRDGEDPTGELVRLPVRQCPSAHQRIAARLSAEVPLPNPEHVRSPQIAHGDPLPVGTRHTSYTECCPKALLDARWCRGHLIAEMTELASAQHESIRCLCGQVSV